MTTPFQRMAQGYAGTDPSQRRRAALASTFTPDPDAERFLAIRETDPQRFEQYRQIRPVGFGSYMASRDAAGYEPEGETA